MPAGRGCTLLSSPIIVGSKGERLTVVRTSFVGELRRRNVHRAAVFYAGAAWLLVQIATQVFPFFEIPNSTVRVVVIGAIVGFPFAMLFSWFYEWTPDGIKRESEVDHREAIAVQTGKKLDKAIIAVLVLAVVLLLTDKLAPRSLVRDARTAGSSPPAATPASIAAPHAAGLDREAAAPAKSIAVLPFSDLSPTHDQEYFSDGMAEELLNALAKVKDLKVAGRTSSFSFKGRNEDLRVVGKALAVANILEGSVRKQGEKVRITAQLIQADNGYHLWSESYDGDLKDVFELQERIARAITEALKVVLVGPQQQRLVPVATDNAEAYGLFLKATTIFNQRDGSRFPEAIAALERAIQLDPKFVRAHARLASLYSIASNWTDMDPDATLEATRRAAQDAIALDPTLAEPHAALGEAYDGRRRPLDARTELGTAVALDPRDVTSLAWLGAMLYADGYLAEGTRYFDAALAIDPLLPIALYWRGFAYLTAGDLASARRLMQQCRDGGLTIGDTGLAFVAEAEGRKDEAIAAYARSPHSSWFGFSARGDVKFAKAAFGGSDADRAAASAMIDSYLATKPRIISGSVPQLLLLLREPERALAVALQGQTNNDSPLFFWLWTKWGRDARHLPQFSDFARQVGWADLWDQYGTPDLCQRRAPRDYVCE